MQVGEHLVEAALKKLGYIPERFGKKEMRQGKTPDFKVYLDGDLCFYCEEKTFTDPSNFYDEVSRKGFCVKMDDGQTKTNRLVHVIESAGDQFLAVNPAHNVPNILALVCFDEAFSVDDIVELFKGYAFADIDGAGRSIRCGYVSKLNRIKFEQYRQVIDAFVILQRIPVAGESWSRLYYVDGALDKFRTPYL